MINDGKESVDDTKVLGSPRFINQVPINQEVGILNREMK